MPITIRRLECHVHVVAGTESPTLHQTPRPAQPSMEYVVPQQAEVVEREEAGPLDAPRVSGSAPAGEGRMSPRELDVNKISERVYELMRREIQSADQRGGLRIRNAKR